MSHQLEHRTVLVTGANGGLGTEFVRQALARGASRVYAAARVPAGLGRRAGRSRCVSTSPIRHRSRRRPARPPTVDLLVNNAGIAPATDASIAAPDRADPDGPVRDEHLRPDPGSQPRSRRCSPRTAAARWSTSCRSPRGLRCPPSTRASKAAAAWSATNGLRVELAAQGTTVTGVIVGMVDTHRWRSVRRAEELCRERRGADVRRRRRRSVRGPRRRGHTHGSSRCSRGLRRNSPPRRRPRPAPWSPDDGQEARFRTGARLLSVACGDDGAAAVRRSGRVPDASPDAGRP